MGPVGVDSAGGFVAISAVGPPRFSAVQRRGRRTPAFPGSARVVSVALHTWSDVVGSARAAPEGEDVATIVT